MVRLAHVPALLASLLLSVALVVPADAPAAAAGTASLSGTVTVPGGVDVTKVLVNLWSPVADERQYTHPDTQGHYRFDGMAAGSYNVEFLDWEQGLIHRVLDESGSVWPISMTEGQQRTGMDVTMEKGAILTGRIFANGAFDLTRVTVTPMTGIGAMFPDAEVHPDGTWVVRSVPSGDYVLRFGGERANLPVVYSPADGTHFSVTAGQTVTGLDVTMTGTTGSISGSVAVPPGADPSAIQVRASGPANGDVRASVAPDGSFALSDLPVGDYTLAFLLAGGDEVAEYWRDADSPAAATTVPVRAGQTTRIGQATVAAPTQVTVSSSKPVAHVADLVQLTATVTSLRPLTGGDIEFRDGETVLGTVPVAGGTASLELTDLGVGSHAITAHFLGYRLDGPSSSPTVTQWVSTPAVPAVSVVDLPTGGRLGGSRVSVRGTGFTDATAVTFGGRPATDLEVVSPTELRVATPAGSGRVPVAVTGPLGTSPDGPGAHFTYTDVVGLTPTRVMDTWMPGGWVQCAVVTGRYSSTLTGPYGVPIGATGVLVNVTTAGATGPGYAVAYPDTTLTRTTPPPSASTVNVEVGGEVANSAFVALSTEGALCVSLQSPSTARVIVDVVGYTLEGSGTVTQTPTRLLDTRGGSRVGEVAGPVAPRRLYTVDVAGRAGVPDDAAAVLLNVTSTGASAVGNLRVFPGGDPVPDTSVLNYAPGADKAAAAVVTLADDGTISFWSDTSGAAQVIFDVVGYVEAGSDYAAVRPERIVDTRAASRTGPIAGPLQGGQVYSLPVAGAGPVPADATAVVLNVTAIGPTQVGNLRVYPDTDGTGSTPPPTASSINYIAGRDIPNQVVVALPANGRVNFFSDTGGSVHLAVDVAGYITTPTDD